MFNRKFGTIATLATLGVASFTLAQQRTTPPPKPTAAAVVSADNTQVEADKALINKYCVGCHGDNSPKAGLSLTKFDLAHPEKNAEAAEKLIKKLRAGMMPPPGSPRPDIATSNALASHVATAIDRQAAVRTEPGRRSF